MTKRGATYTSIHARVTPETERDLFAFHAQRLQDGGTPRHFTASVREVIQAGLRALNAERNSRIVTTQKREDAA